MAITINGSGTIGGVSVGGLPDGIVDTDMLASGAVTSALLPAGSVLQVVTSSPTVGFETNSTTFVDTGHSASYLDSPSTTSSVTYKVYMRTGSTGTSFKYTQYNGSVNPATPATLTLMEIAV